MNDRRSLDGVFKAIERLSAIGVLLTSVEMLSKSKHFNDTGLMSWPVSRLYRIDTTRGKLPQILKPFVSYPAINGVIVLRLLAALFLLTNRRGKRARTAAVAGIAASSVMLSARSPYGLDGADQMITITFLTVLIARLRSGSAFVQQVCLWFLALQSCLSYITAGVAKAFGSMWSDGTAMSGILGTNQYGNRAVGQFLQKHPKLAIWSGKGVTFWESVFPVVLILPRPISDLFVWSGAAFHLGIALTMGLNDFLWAFVATYPAILFCSEETTSVLGKLLLLKRKRF